MRSSRGFTLVELLVVMSIVGILLSVGFVVYRHARLAGTEASAISALQAINQAQFAYMQTCGRQRYAPTLQSLGVPVPGTDTPYLSPDLTAGEQVQQSGYVIQMAGTADIDAPDTCTGATPVSGYQITADPIIPGSTGSRFFGTNTDRVIYADLETFTGQMPEHGPPHRGQELQVSRGR